MSNVKLQFRQDVERFLRMFAGISEYAKQVGDVGSLEQAADEAEKRRRTADDGLRATNARIDVIIGAAEKKADDIVKRAKETAASIEQDAHHVFHEHAERMRGLETETRAGLDSKREEAEAHLKRTLEAVSAATHQLEQIRADVEAAKEQRAQVTSQVAESRTRLDEVTDQLAAMRQRLAS